MAKRPNFKDVWNIKAKFGESKYIKYIKVYISFKATLSAFHCFLFHKNIPNTFEVIALLLKADTTRYLTKCNFFNRDYCYWLYFFEKTTKHPSQVTFGKKKKKKTPKK